MVFDTGLRAQGMIGGRALHTETGLSPIETTSRNRPITEPPIKSSLVMGISFMFVNVLLIVKALYSNTIGFVCVYV